jgi:PadR family transcriptional regulator, regulatory protein PadR
MVVEKEPRIAQLRRGVVEYCVMALLEPNERYGFDLVRELSSSDAMAASEGTLYPILTRLRRDGLVESTWQESPNGPPRRYYRLTDPGREALAGFRRDWVRFVKAVDRLLEGAGHDDSAEG